VLGGNLVLHELGFLRRVAHEGSDGEREGEEREPVEDDCHAFGVVVVDELGHELRRERNERNEQEDEQGDRDRKDTVAESFQPAEWQLIRHTLHRLRSLRCARKPSR
jgi:hypothetical protein